MTDRTQAQIAALERRLRDIGQVAVAVSGGVDSMTLAFVAHRVLGAKATMFHATSPAVPPEAGERVRRHGARHGWSVQVISAGEFDDPEYLANPVNRCFFCKTNLYGAIARHTQATIVSGTNLDDLGDYRPGLQAARDHDVRHPFVEAQIPKQVVRAIARSYGLDDLAALPAAPCLSSRLETGIPVSAPALTFVHGVERLITQEISPQTVRCRVRRDGPAVELDPASLAQLLSAQGAPLRAQVARLSDAQGFGVQVSFEAYRQGSAFLHDRTL